MAPLPLRLELRTTKPLSTRVMFVVAASQHV